MNKEALGYSQNVFLLYILSLSTSDACKLNLTTFQKDVEKAEFLLRQGLFEDEKGRPMNALPLYTDAVHLCLATVSKCSNQSNYIAIEFVIHVS